MASIRRWTYLTRLDDPDYIEHEINVTCRVTARYQNHAREEYWT